MGGGASGDDEELITAINVTPLVDVVLVLLIILMVTATAIVSKTIPMELPEAATGDNTPTTMAISIVCPDQTEACLEPNLFLDTVPVSQDELRDQVSAAKEADDDLRLVIAAEGTIRHRNVVQVIDLVRRVGVTKFAINVRPSELNE
ncbi:MAG: biopolymer transporter ExbD [Myxococcota bacterium]